MDQIRINNLTQKAHIGVDDCERAKAQDLAIDLELGVDMSDCIKSDSISDTLDYVSLLNFIDQHCKKSSWKLAEKFAFDLVQAVFENFNPVQKIRINVRKQILPQINSFEIELVRSRGEL